MLDVGSERNNIRFRFRKRLPHVYKHKIIKSKSELNKLMGQNQSVKIAI